MRWWRIGNAVLIILVLPLVTYLLNRVLAGLERIRHASDQIGASGAELVSDLDGLPKALATTDETIKDVSAGAARYGDSVAKLLGCAKKEVLSMRAAAQTTLTASGLVVGITAVGLTRAIFHLRAIRANLAATTDVTQAIADLTSTVPDRLTSVNASLKPVRDFCDTV